MGIKYRKSEYTLFKYGKENSIVVANRWIYFFRCPREYFSFFVSMDREKYYRCILFRCQRIHLRAYENIVFPHLHFCGGGKFFPKGDKKFLERKICRRNLSNFSYSHFLLYLKRNFWYNSRLDKYPFVYILFLFRLFF